MFETAPASRVDGALNFHCAQSPVARPASYGKGAYSAFARGQGDAGEQAADGALLRRGQAAAVARAGAGGHVAAEVEGGLAGARVLHHAVGRAVERVAALQDRVRDQPALGQREAGADVGGIGGEARVGPAADEVGDRGARQHRARVADQEAVVGVGHAGGGDERMPAAVGAAADVGAIGGRP